MTPEQWNWLVSSIQAIQSQLNGLKSARPPSAPRQEGEYPGGRECPPLHRPEGWHEGMGNIFECSKDKPGKCRRCQARVYWHETKNHKKYPLDADGKRHTDTCPVPRDAPAPQAQDTAEPPQSVLTELPRDLPSDVPF